ncbi:MAG: DoxX family membrane protein [Pseudonocardiaceae bacterium]|nr:DoxX family membrane protein [Pseudonocardiaceae bacterium]
MMTADNPRSGRAAVALPWLATLARLALGTVWVVAGAHKIDDLRASVRAVRAYELLPEPAAQIVGAGLPVAELLLGVLLIVGLGVRAGAVLSVLLLIAFVIGIAAAWARGLRIDCGCFGSGGELGPGQRPSYGPELARDAGLLALAGLLARWPRTRFAVDGWLFDTDSSGTDSSETRA